MPQEGVVRIAQIRSAFFYKYAKLLLYTKCDLWLGAFQQQPVPLLPIAWHMLDLFLQGCRRLREEQQQARCIGAVLVPPEMSSKPGFICLSLETDSY